MHVCACVCLKFYVTYITTSLKKHAAVVVSHSLSDYATFCCLLKHFFFLFTLNSRKPEEVESSGPRWFKIKSYFLSHKDASDDTHQQSMREINLMQRVREARACARASVSSGRLHTHSVRARKSRLRAPRSRVHTHRCDGKLKKHPRYVQRGDDVDNVDDFRRISSLGRVHLGGSGRFHARFSCSVPLPRRESLTLRHNSSLVVPSKCGESVVDSLRASTHISPGGGDLWPG